MRAGRLTAPVLAFVGGVALWEALVRLFDIEAFILPAPSAIWTSFVTNFADIWSYGFRTLIEAVGGLVVGTILGILVAAAVARWTTLRLGAMPFAAAVNAMPIVATAPIFNQLFGLTSPVSKMAVVALMVFFPVMANTTRGLVEADPARLELMRAMAASPYEILRRLRIPTSLPYFFSAMKVAVPLSLIGAIIAEYFGGPQDVLGQYITNRAQLFQFPDAWAAILVSAVLGISMYSIVLAAERLVMPWHVSIRAAE
ncbi:MAG TPA: ABC transporter permease [Acidimicrobiia bacterium]|nr:ABC transporter permease [Acidimicrobiia bacterium]